MSCERIVSILEKAEKLKEKGKKAGDLLDEYLKSVFYEMFGNPARNNKKNQINPNIAAKGSLFKTRGIVTNPKLNKIAICWQSFFVKKLLIF